MKRFSSQAHFAGLGVALILLAAVAIVSYVSWERYVLASNATRHTRALMAQLRDLLTDLQDVENGQRGYLLTGDRVYLAPYEKSLPKIEPDLRAIDKLREADAEETALAQQLESLAKKKLAELRATVDLQRRGDSAGAMAIFGRTRG